MENEILSPQDTPSVGLDHTPAPWHITTYSNYIGYAIHGGDYGCLAERWYEKSIPEDMERQMKANARLIAAAPDLLQACIALQMEARARKCGLRIADEAIARALETVHTKDDALNPKDSV